MTLVARLCLLGRLSGRLKCVVVASHAAQLDLQAEAAQVQCGRVGDTDDVWTHTASSNFESADVGILVVEGGYQIPVEDVDLVTLEVTFFTTQRQPLRKPRDLELHLGVVSSHGTSGRRTGRAVAGDPAC